MEIAPSQIAKLVLGYLKAEKCKAAVDGFIDSSTHLRDFSDTIRKSKHFLTRVQGYSLTDIVTDYAKLYTIIQEYLEDTSYFAENGSRSLTDQLTYLLDNGGRSRPNTPLRSRSSTPVRQRVKKNEFPRDLSVIEENQGDVNATPLHELPGNDSSSALNESDGEPENQQELLGKVLTETFLENHEFQERLAENINAVISKQQDSHAQQHSQEEPVNSELDFAIDTIIQKTTDDPVFEKLINELLGPAITPPTVPEAPNNQNKLRPEEEPEVNPPTVEENVPIQQPEPARITTVPRRQTITIDGTRVDTKDLSVNTPGSDVIMYDGTLENYMKDTQPGTSMIASQATSMPTSMPSGLVLNNGLLMVQPGVVQQQAQPYYLWNPPQILNAVVMPTAATSKPEPTTRPLKKILCKEAPPSLPPPPTISLPEVKKKPSGKRKPKGPVQTITITVNKQDLLDSAEATQIPPQPASLPKIEESPVKEPPAEAPEELLVVNKVEPEEPRVVPEIKPDSPKQSTPKLRPNPSHKGTSTPKSGSHVRALDFNFGTPGSGVKKRSVTSPRRKTPTKNNQPKVSKSLFASPSKLKAELSKPVETVAKKSSMSSWDADLRVLAAGYQKPPSPKKRRPPKKKITKKCLNKTDMDAKAIEENLMQDEKDDSTTHNSVEQVVNEEEEQIPFTLVNYRRPARTKRKCNIDNNVKKEVKITKVKEMKSLDFADGKVILSPSKLNANKRSLVDCEEKHDLSLTPFLNSLNDNEILTLNFQRTKSDLELKSEKPTKTPDFQKPQTSSCPMTATRNLIPLLETPVKTDYNNKHLPKTPNIVSPLSIKDTPLTKMFKEQCQGVDLASIPTPQFPITPSFPITPFGNYSPYTNRPTDYSTSSSYYQPSDTEQNKSIEQYIEDTKKKKASITPKKPEPVTMIANKLSSFNRHVIGRKNLSLVSKADTASFGESTTSDFNSSDTSDEENNTVIHKKVETSRYPLRSRSKKVETNKTTKKISLRDLSTTEEDDDEIEQAKKLEEGFPKGAIEKPTSKDETVKNEDFNKETTITQAKDIEQNNQVIEEDDKERNVEAKKKENDNNIDTKKSKKAAVTKEETNEESKNDKKIPAAKPNEKSKSKKVLERKSRSQSKEETRKSKETTSIEKTEVPDSSKEKKTEESKKLKKTDKSNTETKIEKALGNIDTDSFIKSILVETDTALQCQDSALQNKDPTLQNKDSTSQSKSSGLQSKDSTSKIKDSASKIKDSTSKNRDSTSKIKNTALQGKDSALQSTDSALQAKDSTFQEKYSAVQTKDSAVQGKDLGVRNKSPALQNKDSALPNKDSALQNKDSALQGKDLALQSKDSALQSKDSAVQEKYSAVQTKDSTLQGKDLGMQNKGPALQNKDSALPNKDSALQIKDSTLQIKDSALQGKDSALQSKDSALQGKYSDFQAKDSALRGKDSVLQHKDSGMRNKGPALQNKGPTLKNKNATLQNKDPTLQHKDSGMRNKGPTLQNKDPTLANKNSTMQIKDSTLSSKDMILKELEKKRLQMIAKFKEAEPQNKRKNSAQRSTNLPKKGRKIEATVISSDDDHLSPSLLVETLFEDSSPPNLHDKERSDACMVRDLKERGIYLIPKRKVETKVRLEPPDDNSSTEPLVEKKPKKPDNLLPFKKRDKTLEDTIQKLQKTITFDTVDTKSKIKETVKVEDTVENIKKDDGKNKQIREDTKDDQKQSIDQPKSDLSRSQILQDDLNLTDSITELTFDYLLKPQEDLTIIYDPDKSAKKTLDDYDFTLVSKTVNAFVYLEEFDESVKRIMSITPMDMVLTIPEKKEKVKILENIALTKFNPLRHLYDEMVNETTPDLSAKSPLEDLYNPSSPRRLLNQVRRSQRRRNSVDIKPNIRPRPRNNRSVSVDQDISKKEYIRGVEKIAESKTAGKNEAKAVEEDCPEKNEVVRIDDENSNKVVKVDDSDGKCTVEDKGVIEDPKSTQALSPTKSFFKTDDGYIDLMDYAVVGSGNDSSHETVPNFSNSKRKATDEILGEKSKRQKEDAQEMLKRIDVDKFLSQIHSK